MPPIVVRRCSAVRARSTSCWRVFNLIPIPPLDGSKLLFRFARPRSTAWQVRPSSSSTASSSCIVVFILLGRLDRRPCCSRSSMASTASLWGSKVRQFRAHLRARVSPAERRGPGDLADAGAARAVRLDACRRSASWARRRRDAARGRGDATGAPARRAAPRRRQGRHRGLAAGRLLARPGIRDVDLARRAVSCLGSAPRSSGCATTPRPRPRSRRRPAARPDRRT